MAAGCVERLLLQAEHVVSRGAIGRTRADPQHSEPPFDVAVGFARARSYNSSARIAHGDRPSDWTFALHGQVVFGSVSACKAEQRSYASFA